jgi:hypothetical protein
VSAIVGALEGRRVGLGEGRGVGSLIGRLVGVEEGSSVGSLIGRRVAGLGEVPGLG